MPAAYVKQVADETGKDISKLEKLWDEAKAKVKEEYGDERWPVVVTVFKKMVKGSD